MKRIRDEGSDSLNGGSSQNKVSKYDHLPWEKRAGMLLEVNLKNFMCHEKYHFEPNQRLNFLTGDNGSGKSAVLTAIAFGLGGTARTSNRGSSNKAFIRTGQSSAMVEIRLNNVGEMTYRPDLYGESIIVQRVVTNSSSTYKLKDHDGKIVVDKKVKEELDRILLNFNIQVGNPIAVLNQDTAKTFLFKCEPDKLYTFFMRATQLDQVKIDYSEAAKETSSANALLNDKIESMPNLEKELNKWEKKFEYYQNLAEKKKDIDERKAEVAWAVVRDGEVELEELNTKIDIERKKIPVCDENIEKCTKTEKDAREKKKTIETELQSMSKEVDQDNAKLEDLKSDYHSKREAEKKKKQSVAELERKVKKTEGEVEQYEEEIRRLRSTGNSEYEQKHKERQELGKKLEDEKEALEAQMATTTNHLNHLRANYSQSEDSLKDTRNELNAQRSLANKTSTDLEAIRKGGDRLSAFGSWMPKLVGEIKKSINFRVTPIGPLGAYINLKQNTSKEEARLVEGELGGLVYSFLVENSQDQRELYALFQRLRLPFKPSIFTCPFTDQKHDIREGKVQSPPHLAVIDYLEIENASVFNRVVDSGSAEKILILLEEETVVQNMLQNEATVPRNLKHAITKAGYQYYPAPLYRSYFKENRARGVIKSSLADIIAELEAKLGEEKATVITLEQTFAQKNEEHLGQLKMIEEEDRKVKAVQSRIRHKNMDLVNLKNEDQDDAPPDISALEDDLNVVREKLKTLKVDMNQALKEFKELVDVVAASKDAHTKVDDEINTRRELIDPLSQELSVVENTIKKARKHGDHYISKKNEYKEKILGAENELAIKQVRVECAITKAKEWSEERIVSRKKIDFLSKELARMEESLKTQERTQEPRELVSHNFEKFRLSYARAKHQIKYMSSSVKFLFKMLETRKRGVDLIVRSTTKNVNRNFTSVLNSRQFLGRLYFDHNNHTLEIIVNPSGDPANSQRKLATLSGGEKSFASVSLVLALWDAMTPPFRILDEFDVFMDAVNRRVSLKAIIDCQRSAGRMLGRGRSASIVLIVLIFGLLVTAVNIYQLHKMQAMHFQMDHGPYPEGRPGTDAGQMYVVYAKHPDSGYLKHVYNVLERAGYRRGNYNSTDLWDVMWAHDYPFKKIRSIMEKMRPGQRVNKFPGSGYITNKVNLATSGIPNVPPAFKMPKEKDKLLDYVKSNPDKMFVQKSNNHRGIKIEKIDDLDLDSDGSFVQEFIHNPLLVDGYKFDIGLYVTLTSVDPLRIHVHQSDALLRFCPEKYHPFDQKNKDKYVVNDDYLPLWKVPSLSKHYNDLGFSFKDTLNAHIKSLGKDPEAMWDQMYSTIVEVYRSQEERFVKAASHYPHKNAFFEMVRFDFVIDSDLNVYLMEANMSPNLSSAHFPPNQLLYEQVVHSLLRLVGVISGSIQADLLHPPSKDALDMLVHEKDLYVFPETCASEECSSSSSCSKRKCELCKHCLRKADLEMLRGAWMEGASQFATRRIFPPPVASREEASKEDNKYEKMSDSNRKMHEWYRGKCLMDKSWCNKLVCCVFSKHVYLIKS